MKNQVTYAALQCSHHILNKLSTEGMYACGTILVGFPLSPSKNEQIIILFFKINM